jgi:hypothetical protein
VLIAPATCESGIELFREPDRDEWVALVLERDLRVHFTGLWTRTVRPLFPSVDMGTSALRFIAWEEERLGRPLAPGSTLLFLEGDAPGDRGRIPDDYPEGARSYSTLSGGTAMCGAYGTTVGGSSVPVPAPCTCRRRSRPTCSSGRQGRLARSTRYWRD